MTESKAGTHIGNRVNGVVKPLCGRRNIRGFMTPDVFVQTARKPDGLHRVRLCGNCEEIATRLYLPRPAPEPDRAEAPRLL